MTNTIDIAVELYRDLSRQLDSRHFDSKQEMDESIELLRRALVSGVTPELLKDKLSDLKRARSTNLEFDIKLSTAIRGYYWERSYIQGEEIQYRPFILK